MRQMGYITLAFSGVPTRGDKIRSGYPTPAFSGAHMWNGYITLDFLGVPNAGTKMDRIGSAEKCPSGRSLTK